MPSPAQFDLPEPLLEAALARLVGETDERADAALAELVAAHPEHAARLRALRQALDGASRLLAKSAMVPEADQPAWIDCYRVVRRLGEGGFGVVHLCEQDEPITLSIRAALARADLASAEAELAAFTAAVAEAAHALDAAALWADLARAAALAAPEAGRAPAASAAAIIALRRAVELGFRDRRHLLDAPGLAALRALPEFAAVVATVPQ